MMIVKRTKAKFKIFFLPLSPLSIGNKLFPKKKIPSATFHCLQLSSPFFLFPSLLSLFFYNLWAFGGRREKFTSYFDSKWWWTRPSFTYSQCRLLFSHLWNAFIELCHGQSENRLGRMLRYFHARTKFSIHFDSKTRFSFFRHRRLGS